MVAVRIILIFLPKVIEVQKIFTLYFTALVYQWNLIMLVKN